MSNEQPNIPKGPSAPDLPDEENEKQESKLHSILAKLEPYKEKLQPILDKIDPLLEKIEVIKFKLKPFNKGFDKFIKNLKKGVIEVDWEYFRSINYKRIWDDILDFLDKTVNIDKKKLKLISLIVGLVLFFFLDIFWLITPNKPKIKTEEISQEYKMEEVAASMAKYQKLLLANPNDYKAHIEMGKLYRTLNEIEKAKVSFFQAIQLSPEGFQAGRFSLASLYIKDRKSDLAKKVLKDVELEGLSEQDKYSKAYYLGRIADLYYLQNQLKKSYLAYNDALVILKEIKDKDFKEKLQEIKEAKRNLLIDLADEVYYENHDVDAALAYLDESQKIEENPWAFARKGYLFFEEPKMAAEYFERAFNYNPDTINHEVFMNVLFEAIKASRAEKKTSDAEYYKYVLDKVRAESHHSKVYQKLFVNNVEAYIEKLDGQEDYVPVVYFQVSNASKKVNYDYIKVRVVFYKDNNEIVGHKDVTIVKPLEPLWMGGTTDIVRVESNRPVTKDDKDKSIYKVVLYVSKTRPDEWKLADSTFVKHN